MTLPTGAYAGQSEANWKRVLEVAKQIPRLKLLAENYERTDHPACLNALMQAAIGADSGPIWLAFYSK